MGRAGLFTLSLVLFLSWLFFFPHWLAMVIANGVTECPKQRSGDLFGREKKNWEVCVFLSKVDLILVGLNKWWGRPLFYVGLTLTRLLPKEKVWTKKKKKKTNKRKEDMARQISRVYICVCVCVHKTKVIKKSNFDTSIAWSKEDKWRPRNKGKGVKKREGRVRQICVCMRAHSCIRQKS